jgi:hypothetical protein
LVDRPMLISNCSSFLFGRTRRHYAVVLVCKCMKTLEGEGERTPDQLLQ